MPTAFSRSMLALRADSFRGSLWGLVLVVALLGAGAVWFCLARVEVYEISRQARLEVESQVHPLTALVAGRVVKTHLSVGERVQAGEPLVWLDAEAERLRVEEERARLSALPRRIDALQEEMAAAEQARLQEERTAALGVEEAQARQREGDSAARFAETEAARSAQLAQAGLVAPADREKAEAEAKQKREATRALESLVKKLQAGADAGTKNHQSRLAKLRNDMAALVGERDTCEASLRRLEYERERRTLLAPVTGRLGEVSSLQPGGFVHEGDRLAAIIPEGALRVVAFCSPLTAVGRVHPQQLARLRLDGFPWIQYGSLSGTVLSVANEPRDGLIRVELRVDPQSAPRIPVQHGLPGTAEITVERVSPATLVFRSVGKTLTRSRSMQEATAP